MISGSFSEMWEPTEECESSASLPGNFSRLLKWIEQQSKYTVMIKKTHWHRRNLGIADIARDIVNSVNKL